MYYLRRKTFKTLSLLLAATISLTGCNTGGRNAGVADISQEQSIVKTPQQTVDWNSHQLVTAQEAVDGAQWYLREYYENWITYPEKYSWNYSHFYKSSKGDLCAQTQYALYNEDGSFSRAWDCLDYFDMETLESFHAEVDLDQWDVPKTASLALADVADDRLVACYFYTTEEVGTPKSYCSLVFYHMEKGLQKPWICCPP